MDRAVQSNPARGGSVGLVDHGAGRGEAGGPDVSFRQASEHSGGLEGGVTTGQPLVARAAMKPIATTLTSQPTVDLSTGEETLTRYERSVFCPVPRAVPILEAMMAFVLADALLEKLGGDSLGEMRSRFAALRKANLDDLKMEGGEHLFWPGEMQE